MGVNLHNIFLDCKADVLIHAEIYITLHFPPPTTQLFFFFFFAGVIQIKSISQGGGLPSPLLHTAGLVLVDGVITVA